MKTDTMMVQCHFASDELVTIGYVEADSRIRPGVRVTLKDSGEPDRLWTVTWVGEPRPRSWLKRGWANNI